MRRILAAAAALSFLLPAFAAEPPTQQLRPIEDDPGPTRPFRGSTVLVPPLVSERTTASGSTKVLRLPVQAGKVSKMVTTSLVSGIPSWIAKGHKFYSLCVPNRRKVACAPIVATATMKDIEVGAVAGADGVAKLTFRVGPNSKQGAKRLIASINYFLFRASKQAEHFNRKAVNYAPEKGAGPLKAGISKTVIIEPGGAGCGYDDFGGYDCSGGDSGYDGEGYDATEYYNDSDYWGDEDSWGDPSAESAIPSFPSGNDNGEKDPCIDASGNNICQQVVITGERPDTPQEMAVRTCIITPWAMGCTSPPPLPIGIDPIEVLPRGPTPWLPQSACNFSHFFCSGGQVPEIPPPPLTDAEKLQARKDLCYKEVDAEMTTCRALKGMYHDPNNRCMENAIENLKLCDKIGQNGY